MLHLLDGVRVLELGAFITGPYAGQLLAEFGAHVTKIEKPGSGDPFRGFTPGERSPQFCAYNRGKYSVALDIGVPAGRDALLRLAAGADVLLDNFRPDVLDRLGLGWETLQDVNPAMIYCNISGFGPDGPYAKRPAYDTVAMAMSGFSSQLLDPDRPRIAGPAIADAVSGLYAALAIAAALAGRARDGKGHRLDVPMLEAMAAFATEPLAGVFARGTPPGPYDRAAASQSFAVRCADGGMIGLHLSSPQKFWDSLRSAIGPSTLDGDDRFASRAGRMEHFAALGEALSGLFAARTRAEWEERLRAADVPHAPVYSLPEMMADPQVVHLGTIYDIPDARLGSIRAVQSPVWCDRARAPTTLPPPMLGEHTEQALRGAGLGDDDIGALRAAGGI